MLGEKIGSIVGNVTSKPMSAVNGYPAFENVDSGGTGTLAGVKVQSFATFTSQMKPDGSWSGTAPYSGVVMAPDGVAIGNYSAVGHPTAEGGFSFRGIAYFESTAPSLAALNGKACIFEYESGSDGKSVWDLWEWN